MISQRSIGTVVCGLLVMLLLGGCAGSRSETQPGTDPIAVQPTEPMEADQPLEPVVPTAVEIVDPAPSAETTLDAKPAAEEDEYFDPFESEEEDPFDEEEALLPTVFDPFSGINRAVFVFNDKMYFWVLKPVATGYRYVVPSPVRTGIKNFFYNVGAPVRMVNCLLQGKGTSAGAEFGRFLVNTVGGLGGLLDPASQYAYLNPPEEDFGQTLGSYSIGNGFYIVWPLLGPSTLRDTVGMAGDWAASPLGFMQLANIDAGALTEQTTGAAIFAGQTVNDTSFRIGDYEALKNAALDPYEAFRDAYIQNRNSKIAQ